jgi:WD40 repeat protein
VGTAVRSLTVALDGSMMVAANNHGTCYVWRMLRGSSITTHFEPLHKLRAHSTYILKCLISPDVQQLATTSADKTVKLWNLDNFTLNRTLTGEYTTANVNYTYHTVNSVNDWSKRASARLLGSWRPQQRAAAG